MKNLNPQDRKSFSLFSSRFILVFIYIGMFTLLSMCKFNEQEYTRGVGVYPGDVKEDFSPVMYIDKTGYLKEERVTS